MTVPTGAEGVGLSLTSLNAGIEIGSIVGGKFRMERILAEGGMGLVAAATHLQLEQTVALKFFRGDVMTTGESRLRFMREAKAAAQLKSEHVARVLDVGVSEGGAPYIVMEYLDGQGLERIIATEQSLDPASACEYAIHACEALAEAHARGIIHRDIKPSNLFLAERAPGWRAIKVLDFGVSKMSLAQASNITTSLNVVMGTPCYMSPEQIHSAATVDHRTDIWSLGATLYQMLTGRPPFDPSLPILALAEEIAGKKIPAVSDVRAEVPRALSDVVARCLLRDRDQRIGSAAELAAALVPFAPPRAQLVAERAATIAAVLGAGAAARSLTPPGTPSPAVRSLTPPAAQDLATPLPPVPSPYPPSPSYLTNLNGDAEVPFVDVEVEVDIEAELDSDRIAGEVTDGISDASSDGIADPDKTPERTRFASPTETPRVIPWSQIDAEPAPVESTALVPFGRPIVEPVEVWMTPRSIALLAAGSILLCVFAFLILPRLVQPARVAARGAAAPARSGSMSVVPAEGGFAGAPSKSSTLVVYVSPASAQIVVDGVLAMGNPFRAQFPSGGVHVVKAFASGYEPRVEQAHLISDVVINLSLDRSARLPWRRSLGRTVAPRPAGATTNASRGSDGSGARDTASSGASLVDPHGGRAPLHPIVTVSPYDAQ
jgi:serine/threonine protein kinase